MDEGKTKMIVYMSSSNDIDFVETLAKRHVGLKAFYKGKPRDIKLTDMKK
jgi:hypothetical protein